MTTITAQIKIHASIDLSHLGKSKVQVHGLHAGGWRPLFEFTAADLMKLFNKQKRTIRKGKKK